MTISASDMEVEESGIQLFNTSGAELPITQEVSEKIISHIETDKNVSFSFVELVYVDESEIVRINKKHLNREYITDIISFRYDDDISNQAIEGTLFCCAQRILEQSTEFNSSPAEEFKRILIHGLLHLMGYDDQNEEEKAEMTALENHFLELS
jgi:rRNA maturation RNase YbeY